ncbi:50S ribosomal protein L11 methyltransferase [Streptomyces sp. NPDC101132]|uniref:50S ribosomal protein L11 methyltransferase n=1 Tax=Streptomyces sp. NPDC101132 TaxID=3366110 RepID=UPI00380D5B8D
MSHISDYRRSLERSRLSRASGDRPGTFDLRGREWDLLPDVFAPSHSRSTDVAMKLLGFDDDLEVPRAGSFLEIGSGTGVIAVSAALAGCERVVGSDISPQAVRNTALNAERHGVSDRLRAVQGDLFEGLTPGERFSTVYWHSNFVLAPADYTYRHVHERAYVDPGYAAHLRYLREAPLWTEPGGSALLHFSDRGDVPGLWNMADSCGRELRVLRSRRIKEGAETVEHMLFEITVAEAVVPMPLPKPVPRRTVPLRGPGHL